MNLISRARAYFNKDGFDYSKGYVHPYEFHTTFYLMLKVYQLIDDEPIPKWTNITQTLMATSVMFNVFLAITACYNAAWPFKLSLATEVGTYFLVLIYGFFIMWCSKLNLKSYHCMLRILRQDFHYICTEGSKYRKQFFEYQLQSWKIALFSLVFPCIAAVAMDGCILFLVVYYHIEGNDPETQRQLPIPIWLFDSDLKKSPYYELCIIYSIVGILAYAFNYIFMIQTQVIWIREVGAKVDIIIWLLNDLYEGLSDLSTSEEDRLHRDYVVKERLRKIIRHHHCMYELIESYSEVYKKLLMFEQTVCSPIVCLTAYCTVQKLEEGELNGILAVLGIATIVLLSITSLLCTFFSEKVISVCDACFSVPFYESNSKLVRPYLVLLMQRSQRPLPLQATGFEVHCLQTFSKKISAAYSMFNMLRQANI